MAGDSAEARTPRHARPDPRALLAWYDRHRRAFAWRTLPGGKTDPYRVWLSEIMLQQTRVETVARYYDRFLDRFPDVVALADARLDTVLKSWAGLGYYARARNMHACARVVRDEHAGRFPETEAALRNLPGVGAYTAAAVASIAFDRPTVPVDGNIERVVARLFAVETPLPAARPELHRLAQTLVVDDRPGDMAQALMDLGATVCTPRRPACAVCPWIEPCAARRRGDPENFPRRTPKQEGALRRGAAFVLLRADDSVLVRRRAPSGLLGGMTEVPTTEWSRDFDAAAARDAAPAGDFVWRRLPGAVRHVFTHFPLELAVYLAVAPAATRAPRGMRFVPLARLDREALPSLMRKVVAHALNGRGGVPASASSSTGGEENGDRASRNRPAHEPGGGPRKHRLPGRPGRPEGGRQKRRRADAGHP